MNSQNKIPMWPLYAADAAMFITAFLIALPNAVSGQRMGLEQTLLCVFMVFAAMLMLASPYIFDTISSKRNSTEFEKSAAQKFSAAADAFEAIDAKFSEHAENFNAIKDSLEKIAEKFSEVKTSEKKHADDLKTLKLGTEYFKVELEKLSKKLDDAEIKQAKADEETSEISEEFDEIKSRMDSAEGECAKIDQILARIADLENAVADLKDSVQAPEDDETDGDLKDVSLLGKAMKSAGTLAGSRMSRLISESISAEQASNEALLNPQRTDDGDFLATELPVEEEERMAGSEESSDEIPEEEDLSESGEEPFEADYSDIASEEADEPSDSANADASSLQEEEVEEEIEDSDMPEEEPEVLEPNDAGLSEENDLPTEESYNAPEPKEETEPALFDLEQSPEKAKVAKKGQTSLIVNAMIGIGNKPYLRGNGGGLSTEKGIPMDFVEIGKWQWICPEEISAPVELEVLVNDDIKIDGAKYTVSPNQKLEVNLIYSK